METLKDTLRDMSIEEILTDEGPILKDKAPLSKCNYFYFVLKYCLLRKIAFVNSLISNKRLKS